MNGITKEKLEIDAFCKIAKCITNVKSKQDVFILFDVLQGTAGVDTIKHISRGLSQDQMKLSTAKWQRTNHWVQWWTRPKHLKMLC